MKLSSKISLGMGVLTILAGILACYLLVQMDEINENVTELADQKMPILDLIGKLNGDVPQQRIVEIRHIYSTDNAVMAAEEKTLEKWRETVNDEMEELDKAIYVPNARAIFNRLKAARGAYREVSARLLDLSRQNHTEQAVVLLNDESRQKFDAFSAILKELSDVTLANARQTSKDGDEKYESSRAIGIILTLAAIFIALALTWLIVRNTVRQLGKDPGELNASPTAWWTATTTWTTAAKRWASMVPLWKWSTP